MAYLEDSHMISPVIVTGLESALNQVLRLDPDSASRLAALDGKTVAVEVEGLEQRFYLRFAAEGVRVMDHDEGTAVVWIRGTPLALLRQWRRQSFQDSRQIKVEGNSDVAREVQLLLARLDIDWEEQLAKRFGDPIAHQLGNVWRSLRGWGRRVSAVVSANSTEYLQHELGALPPSHVVERFLHDVDILREDADRLAVRVERLRQRLAPGGLG